MKTRYIASALVIAGVFLASPVFAQTSSDSSRQMTQTDKKKAQKQPTQGELPQVGPASGAYKQPTQGALPTVGPASGAYNQPGTR